MRCARLCMLRPWGEEGILTLSTPFRTVVTKVKNNCRITAFSSRAKRNSPSRGILSLHAKFCLRDRSHFVNCL